MEIASKKRRKIPNWCRPTFSPEHGVLLVWFGSFLTGAALAQHWHAATNLALLCSFFALQWEHPFVVQLKLRKSWKPRYLVWGGVYGVIALSLAIFLGIQSPALFWIYGLSFCGFIGDGIAVVYKKHKSIANEILSFATICLSAPLAYTATTHHLSGEAMAIWLLNTLFFSSAVFTIKLRRKKTRSLRPGIIYHGVALLVILGLSATHYLPLITALSFVLAMIKLGIIICRQQWYRKTKFPFIAIFETRFALLYIAIASISLLPAHLPPT